MASLSIPKNISNKGAFIMAKQVEVLSVEGMSCSHCEARVKKAAGALSGVSAVSVDLKGKKVTVEFDPGVVSVPAIKAAIEDQGYEVK
jgi:copper chaperone